MALSTHQDRNAYIASLELDESRRPSAAPRAVRFADGDEAAYVDAGSLVSFAVGVSAEHQSDILNSTLLAQLAANKKYNRETQTVEWYAFYHEVLENIGWVIQDFSFTRFSASGGSASVDAVVMTLLAALATGSQLALAQTTIKALQSLPANDSRVVLFETNSHTMDKGNFQIGLANDDGGIPVMTFGAFYFSSSQQVTRLFSWEFKDSDTSFYQATETVSLNEDVYGQVRQQIIQKLGANATLFVANLDI
ncbi:MAG TPA: hypothetical protein VFS20_31975 [Longimicrobium sp.]|nr:hypothetical protein [Longimicrobium sp.]